MSSPAARPTDVYFFATCVVDQFFPGAGMDAITLLERQGIRVHFPEEQTCCGQPAYTSGFPDEARKVAAHQLTLFPNDWPVVVPSGSCAGMIRWHWEKVIGNDPALKARAAAIAARTNGRRPAAGACPKLGSCAAPHVPGPQARQRRRP